MSVEHDGDNRRKSTPWPIHHAASDPLHIDAYLHASDILSGDGTEPDDMVQALADLRAAYVMVSAAYAHTLMFALRQAANWRTLAADIGPPSTDTSVVEDGEEQAADAAYETLIDCASDLEISLNLVDHDSAEADEFREVEGRWPRHQHLRWVSITPSEVP